LTPEAILADLIKINTTNPPGNETEAALYLKNLFDAAGIPCEIIESEPGRGNFIARMGKGERKILFLSHTDVVPAGEGWDLDPFSGEIKNGTVYGRGAIDCKSLVAAGACAMLTMAKEPPLNGVLIFAATADEEKGGKYGVRYLVERHREKIQADFTVNEGAEEPIVLSGQPINFIQTGEKGTAWSKLEVRGVSCHGSLPGLGDNAVIKMASAVKALAEYKPEIRIIPEVALMLHEILRLKKLEIKPEEIDTILERFEDKTFAGYLRAVTRMTVSPNVIHGGEKVNIIPDYCQAELDIRILPGQDNNYVQRELQKLLPEGTGVEILNYHSPSFSPVNSPYYTLLEATLKKVAGEIICLPQISTGATDSRFLREMGIPCYGISPMAKDFDSQIKATIHGKNERIDVASLQVKVEFLVALARAYLR